MESGSLAAGEVLRYAEWADNISYGGDTYYAAPISSETITENMSQEIDQLSVKFGNVDRSFVHYLESHDGLRECKVTIKTVFADLLADDAAHTDDIFYVASSSMGQTWAIFLLKSKLSLLSVQLPNRRFYRDTCQWGFKSTECGYAGAETTCNHTTARCLALANLKRFGGFPGTGQALWRVLVG